MTTIRSAEINSVVNVKMDELDLDVCMYYVVNVGEFQAWMSH